MSWIVTLEHETAPLANSRAAHPNIPNVERSASAATDPSESHSAVEAIEGLPGEALHLEQVIQGLERTGPDDRLGDLRGDSLELTELLEARPSSRDLGSAPASQHAAVQPLAFSRAPLLLAGLEFLVIFSPFVGRGRMLPS